jgi:hypothetical protein
MFDKVHLPSCNNNYDVVPKSILSFLQIFKEVIIYILTNNDNTKIYGMNCNVHIDFQHNQLKILEILSHQKLFECGEQRLFW